MASESEVQLDTNPKERFYRYFHAEVAALRDQISNLTNLSLTGGERNDAADHCLAGIGRLSDEVKDAGAYVPGYDVRVYVETIKTLQSQLDTTRRSFGPPKKFSFKTRKTPTIIARANPMVSDNLPTKNGAAAAAVEPPKNGVPSTQEEKPTTSTANKINPSLLKDPNHLLISNLSYRYVLSPISSPAPPYSSGSITALTTAILNLLPSPTLSTLHLRSLSHTALLLPPIHGALHVTGLERCVVVVRCGQFRMHDSRDVVVWLECGSRPIIEGCGGVIFRSVPKGVGLAGAEDGGGSEGGGVEGWLEVDDFSWLKEGKSPNFRILGDGEEGEREGVMSEEVWRRILGGTEDMDEGEVRELLGMVLPGGLGNGDEDEI